MRGSLLLSAKTLISGQNFSKSARASPFSLLYSTDFSELYRDLLKPARALLPFLNPPNMFVMNYSLCKDGSAAPLTFENWPGPPSPEANLKLLALNSSTFINAIRWILC
jgi:hypothetical protein